MRHSLMIGLLACAGCGNANIAGNYNVTVTDGQNGCNFGNWTQGMMSSNIPFDITQQGTNASGTVGGVTGGLIAIVEGSATFNGTVGSNVFDLKLVGMRALSMGACAYTINAEAVGTITGDTITGTIDYSAMTNGSPDCGVLTGCHSHQDFTGVRAPQG
jgi:hypothetical protein